MKQYAPLLLLILLLSACAPTQAETFISTITMPAISTQVTPSATDTPHIPTATPRPSTATTNPTQVNITMMWSTKSVLLTAYPAPTFPTETPTPILLQGALVCRPTDLHATYAGEDGAAGHLILYVRVYNTLISDCFLPTYPVVHLLDPTRKPINIIYSFSIPDSPIVPVQPTDESNPG